MLRLGLHQRPFLNVRTHVSRAAKKLADQKQNVPPSVEQTRRERATRLLPQFMRGYVERVANAPLSHVTAFLVVHELSAIVPLFGIWGGLYYFDYVPGMPDFVVQSGAHFIRSLAERQGWTFIQHAETGSKIILQGAAAWGVVKALMPLRIAFSLWAMPGFARWAVIPITTRVSALVGKLRRRR